MKNILLRQNFTEGGAEMREIKFRGKRIDNGEWVYGYYWTNEIGNHFIKAIKSKNDNFVSNPTTNDFEVNPETVGQYTGLTDKNGKKIFEGDILERSGFWGWYVAYEDGGFRKISINTVQRINWEHSLLEQDTVYYWEIIGNIHDNPELVKEEMK